MNSQLQGLLEKQGSELKQAKQLIPGLQRQVTSLTGQLQNLAQDLAEVKADKYSGRGLYNDHFSPSTTASNDEGEAANSLFDQEFSSGDYTTTPESPDDMFLKDLNPCLTPYSRTKSKEFGVYSSPDNAGFCTSVLQSSDKNIFNSCATKLSKSSECCQSSKSGMNSGRAARRSDGSKGTHGKTMHHKRF